MSISLNTNTQSLLTQSNLLSKNSVNKSTQSLSIGIDINTGNSAAGVFLAQGSQCQLNAAEQCQTNIAFGINILHIADDGLANIQNNVSGIKDICEKFASGEGSPSERAKMQEQINSYMSNIDDVANSSNFVGINLLCSTGNNLSMGLNIQVGVDSDVGATSIQIDGVFGSADSGSLFSINIDITQDGGAAKGLSECENVMKLLSERRAKISDAKLSLEEAAAKWAEFQKTDTEDSEAVSEENAMDVWTQAASYSQQLILQQVSTSIWTQANQSPTKAMALMS